MRNPVNIPSLHASLLRPPITPLPDLGGGKNSSATATEAISIKIVKYAISFFMLFLRKIGQQKKARSVEGFPLLPFIVRFTRRPAINRV